MESTLNIKHSAPVGRNADSKEPLINALLEFVDLQKSINDEFLDNQLTQMVNDYEIEQIVGEKVKKIIQNRNSCKKCQKPRFRKLTCTCFLCFHETEDLVNSIWRLFSNENLENFEDLVDSVSCPKCKRKVIQNDLEVLIPSIQEEFQEHLRNSIIQSAQSSGQFKCLNCKKVRGRFLLPDLNAHPCLHMCLFCIFEKYAVSKSRNCVICKKQIQMSLLFPIKTQCFECNKEFYFGGDRMIEIDPGVILCPNCIYVNLLNRFSNTSNRNLELSEIMDYYFYLFKVCNKCGTEVFIEEMEQKKCCFNYFCKRCLSNSVNRCPKCTGID